MKTFLITLTITLLFCISHANAQGVTVSNFDGAWDNDTKVLTGRPVTWTLRLDTPYDGIILARFGFKVFISNDSTGEGILDPGPGFEPLTYNPLNWEVRQTNQYINGFGVDIVSFWIHSFAPCYHFHEDILTLTTQVEDNAIGLYLCLDSSRYYASWIWSACNTNNRYISWDGPHCYLIEDGCHLRGDANHDGNVLVDDFVLLRDHLFHGGPAPISPEEGDVTGDGNLNVNDLVFIIDYLFKGGDAPPLCD